MTVMAQSAERLVSLTPAVALYDVAKYIVIGGAEAPPTWRRIGEDGSAATVRIEARRSFAGEYWIAGGVLRQPIHVHVTSEEASQLVVSDTVTGIFGAGPDLAAAVEDFRAAVSDHRDFLESAGPLSDDLRDQLRWLQTHLNPSA